MRAFVLAFLLVALFAASTEAFFAKKPTPAKAPVKGAKKAVAVKKPVAAKRAAPVAPKLTRKPKEPLPVSKKSAPKAPPKKFSPKPAAPGVSKQRPFAFGGRTPGPELYDDGLTEVERRYIERGAKQALTGAAKLRFTFSKQGGKGYN